MDNRLSHIAKVALRLLLTAVVMMGAASPVPALAYRLKGKVVEAGSGDGVPYATVTPRGTSQMVLTDERGRFIVEVDRSIDSVAVSGMGYGSVMVAIDGMKGAQGSEMTIVLDPIGVSLGEVTARPTKEKYSKRGNPAVEFRNRIAHMADATDPLRNPYYNYRKYEKIVLALNNTHPGEGSIFSAFPCLEEFVDTSLISGAPVLNISVREQCSTHHFRRDPSSSKTYITGIDRRGIDELIHQESMQTFLTDVLRDIDIYDRDINILQNRFVSPLSPIAPDFYKFYLTDTVMVAGERCIELTFVPRTSESFGFTGRFYVAEGDTTMFIKKVTMGVPADINLNWIDRLYINQEFERAPDGSRLITRDDLALEMNVLGQGLYMRRNTAYADHDFEPPSDPTIWNGLQRVEELPQARIQPPEFWAQNRLIPISRQEGDMRVMMTTLRQNKLYYWGEQVIKVLATGYITPGARCPIDIGPMNTTISGNKLEGVRLRVGALTNTNLSRNWFFRCYGAYGTRDHRWKYLAEAEYSFHDKRVHPREFPVHSIAITSMYDVDMLGQHYLFTNPDNFVLSFKRGDDVQMTYHYVNKLTYTLELYNNFSVEATLKHERQQVSPWMTFIDGYGNSFDHYDESSFTLQLRYAPGERYFQTRSKRIPVNLDAPVFVLSHTIAPRGFAGSRFTINKTEMSIQKRFWFSAFGYTDVIVKGGHVWSRSPYPNLLIPNANLSYTIQPESFALLNAMEFINDSYLSWDLTYWANGAIFNYIPLLKKTKLREVVAFRGIWGHLSHRNRPDLNPSLYRFPEISGTRLMTSTPYMEISAGIDNLFKCLRVDYVWRLTYRDDTGSPSAPRGGLRVALHLTF